MSKKKIKAIDESVAFHKSEIERLEQQKIKLENENDLPKVTSRYLNKFFRKVDFFNKKSTMLIHVRKILSCYNYEGIKIQFHPNGSLEVDLNYRGHFSSIGKQVEQKEWRDELNKAITLVEEIPYGKDI